MGNDSIFLFLRDTLKISPPKARDIAISIDSAIFGILVGLFIFFALGGVK